MTTVRQAYSSDYIFFENLNSEPEILKGGKFNEIYLPTNSYSSAINRGPGDAYHGEEIWWIYHVGWDHIDLDAVPAKLRTIRLLLDKRG